MALCVLLNVAFCFTSAQVQTQLGDGPVDLLRCSVTLPGVAMKLQQSISAPRTSMSVSVGGPS